jgi:hypothetical protein
MKIDMRGNRVDMNGEGVPEGDTTPTLIVQA